MDEDYSASIPELLTIYLIHIPQFPRMIILCRKQGECSHGTLSACALCSVVSSCCGRTLWAQGHTGSHSPITAWCHRQDCLPAGTNEADHTSSSCSLSYKLASRRIFREFYIYQDDKHVPILLISADFHPISRNRTTSYIYWSWQYVHLKFLLFPANYAKVTQ